MAEIEIVQVHTVQRGADLNDEYIVIQNQSTDRYHIVGWSVAEHTFGGELVACFEFPAQVDGQEWSFDPGEEIYLMTGHGAHAFLNDGYHPPQFLFFMRREHPVWCQCAGAVLLRRDGQRIHWLPSPPRLFAPAEVERMAA